MSMGMRWGNYALFLDSWAVEIMDDVEYCTVFCAMHAYEW
jgi:hypothetical protein